MSHTSGHSTTLSHVFCCGQCHDSVALIELPGGDLGYECTNPACAKTVHVDCPEALARIEDVILKLPSARALGRRLATARDLVTT
jgi:hypothetical protein